MSSFSFTNELTMHFHKFPGSRRAIEELAHVPLQEFTESIEPGIKPTRLVSQRGFALNELLRRLDDFGSLHRYCRRDCRALQ